MLAGHDIHASHSEAATTVRNTDATAGVPPTALPFADCYGIQRVALLDGVNDILTRRNFAEDGVFAVEPVGHDMRDEKLAAVRVWAGVRH